MASRMRRRRRRPPARTSAAASSSPTSSCSSCGRSSLVVQQDVRRRARQPADRADRPRRRPTRCSSRSYVALWAVAINTVFGVGISLLLRALRLPRPRRPVGADRPAAVGLARRRRPRAAARLRRHQRPVRAGARVGRLPDRVRDAGHHHGHRLRQPAARDPRARAGAAGDRHRAGAGGAQPRRRAVADLPAHHAAVDQWALVYGVVLSLARSLGEFGAVKIVSGNIAEQTQTATLVVEQKYQDFEQGSAYATVVPARTDRGRGPRRRDHPPTQGRHRWGSRSAGSTRTSATSSRWRTST